MRRRTVLKGVPVQAQRRVDGMAATAWKALLLPSFTACDSSSTTLHHLMPATAHRQQKNNTLMGARSVAGHGGHGWAIALNCWGRRLANIHNNSELFYVLGRDCPSMLVAKDI